MLQKERNALKKVKIFHHQHNPIKEQNRLEAEQNSVASTLQELRANKIRALDKLQKIQEEINLIDEFMEKTKRN